MSRIHEIGLPVRRALVLVAVCSASACAEKQAAPGAVAASSSGDEERVVDVSCGLEVDESRFEPTDPEPPVEPVDPEGQAERDEAAPPGERP